MSELNELFGPSTVLPPGAPCHLVELADSIASFPEGERVPSMRIWCNPAMTGIYLDGLDARELQLQNLVHLRSITLYGCPLERFPALTRMTELTSIECLYGGRFRYISDLSTLVNLTTLRVEEGLLEDAYGIKHLSALQDLSLAYNHLVRMPPLNNLAALKSLSVSDNLLTDLPELGAQLLLEQLDCDGNRLTVLPPLNHLSALSGLYCRNNQLTELPELNGLIDLKYLYCNTNQLASLPSLAGLSELLYLHCYENQLTVLPDLTGLTKLRYVRAEDNQLSAEAIDNALIQLAGAGMATNGSFNYSGNPGAPNEQRSTEAAAAKTTLTSRGWAITI
jgi:hypothetical protein